MRTDSDDVIEEIRQSRKRMSEQSGHDPGKYIDLLKTLNRKYATQVKRFQKLHRVSPVEHTRSQ